VDAPRSTTALSTLLLDASLTISLASCLAAFVGSGLGNVELSEAVALQSNPRDLLEVMSLNIMASSHRKRLREELDLLLRPSVVRRFDSLRPRIRVLDGLA
jgi:hypothetical protein